MKILKQGKTGKFLLLDASEEWLIGQYNTNLNYLNYLKSIMQLSDAEILKLAPGNNIESVKENLKLQLDACNDFIATWNTLIAPSQNAKKN
jgi:hypothetical protein